MTTQDHYGVELDQILGHAGTVGAVADELSAIAADLPGGLGGDALGTFTQFLATGLDTAMTQVADAITHASSSVDEVSAGLSRTADGYQRTDDTNATNLTREYP